MTKEIMITEEMRLAGANECTGWLGDYRYRPDDLADDLAEMVYRAMEKVRADNWRPIETAPKDGTAILLSDGDSVTVAQFLDPGTAISDAAYHEVRREAFGARLVQLSLMRLRNPPTHWMPLPSAPKPAPENKHQGAPLMPVPHDLPIVIPGELAVGIEYSLLCRGSELSLQQAARLMECINQALRNAGLPEIQEETRPAPK